MGRYWNITLNEYLEITEESLAIREYECKNPERACDRCLESFELQQKISDDLIRNCPYCGSPVKQLMSMSSFQLLGDGWTRRGA